MFISCLLQHLPEESFGQSFDNLHTRQNRNLLERQTAFILSVKLANGATGRMDRRAGLITRIGVCLLIAVLCVSATHWALRSAIALIVFVQDTVSPHIRVNRWLHLAVVMWFIDFFPTQNVGTSFSFLVSQPTGLPVSQNIYFSVFIPQENNWTKIWHYYNLFYYLRNDIKNSDTKRYCCLWKHARLLVVFLQMDYIVWIWLFKTGKQTLWTDTLKMSFVCLFRALLCEYDGIN